MTAMNIAYHDDPKTGYGRFGIAVRDELVRQGVTDLGALGVNDGAMPSPTGIAPTCLYLSTPSHVTGWIEGQFAAIFTMWEFSELPQGFRENVPEFHQVFVPSRQNEELFGHFNDNVSYIPLAVGKEWTYRERTWDDGRFHVLTGGAGPRKGCPAALRAFNTAFRGWKPDHGPEPHMTIRAKPTADGSLVPSPRVSIIAQPLPADLELDLYGRSHLFVSMSQGEGWGLMPHQAIASGLPTILGNAHGHAAFAHYGMPVRTVETPVGDYATHWGNPGCAWVPDFDETVDLIRWTYQNYEAAEDYACGSAHMIATEFSWERTAREVLAGLPEIPQRVVYDVEQWHVMPQRLYDVRVRAHSMWCVMGVQKTFDPGEQYYETWDWKERLASRGDLLPECINQTEMGYINAPKVAVPRCPHCNQLMGSDTSLLPENLVTNG